MKLLCLAKKNFNLKKIRAMVFDIFHVCNQNIYPGTPYTCEVGDFVFWKTHITEDTNLGAYICHKKIPTTLD